MLIALSLILLAAAAVDAWRDPRKLRIGVTVLVACTILSLEVFGRVLSSLEQGPTLRPAAIFLLALAAVVALSVLTLGVMLVLNGAQVLSRERRSLANALSLLVGVLLLAFLAFSWVSVFGSSQTFFVLVLTALPLGYLGFGLFSYVVTAASYTAWFRHRGGDADAVVVLGSGLAGGRRVTPLLAGRVDAGLDWRSQHTGPGDATPPWLVLSGGRGPDEQVSEAQAMAEYAAERGVEDDRVLLEDASRNTEQNLRFSRDRLAEHGCDASGGMAVATSSYHAFRAALLMRRLGIPGYTVGARTTRYYWPSALIREYLAVLRDHTWLNVSAVAALTLPLLAFIVAQAVDALT